MGQVLAQLIPVALAAAMSTVPIMATLFILLSDRRRVTALPFLSGWVLGTAARPHPRHGRGPGASRYDRDSSRR